jgi:hypothetical protein
MRQTAQDQQLASYWRAKAKRLEALLDDWERTVGSYPNNNVEDLPYWLGNVVDRLKGKREDVSSRPPRPEPAVRGKETP